MEYKAENREGLSRDFSEDPASEMKRRLVWTGIVGRLSAIAFVLTALLCLMTGCKNLRLRARVPASASERGIVFSHAKHLKLAFPTAGGAPLQCDHCHRYKMDLTPKWPDPRSCMATGCHRAAIEHPNETEALAECSRCHTRSDRRIVLGEVPARYSELKFLHKPHLENKLECKECHVGIRESERVTPEVLPTMLKTCIPCHEKRGREAVACHKCHKSIDKSYKPLYHAARDVNHSDPPQWLIRHGTEFQFDRAYCRRCHSDQSWCVRCHQDAEPRDHNNVWRIRSHGFEASWNRRRCQVCHQQDFCVRCHENTRPRTHTASWRRPLNRHCANCHIPVSGTSCRVCHISAEHTSAAPSPHPPFVGNCFLSKCHPLGRPGEARHLDAMGIHCTACHRR